ncbi:Glycogenin-1 [Caligus rogercresseyi]|uniref:Glycogenin-1 n=1 Tax=Caligus rogercresseyi TaxID=217165 RepID=A0A7T8GZ70_CALRO|nr:Glycogenin-1 [Caligus rogercresseyi]
MEKHLRVEELASRGLHRCSTISQGDLRHESLEPLKWVSHSESPSEHPKALTFQ